MELWPRTSPPPSLNQWLMKGAGGAAWPLRLHVHHLHQRHFLFTPTAEVCGGEGVGGGGLRQSPPDLTDASRQLSSALDLRSFSSHLHPSHPPTVESPSHLNDRITNEEFSKQTSGAWKIAFHSLQRYFISQCLGRYLSFWSSLFCLQICSAVGLPA